jgi:hypothetical protein
MTEVSLEDVRAIAIGAGILGTGGGGNTHLGRLWLEQEFRARQTSCCIIQPDEANDEAYVCGVGKMGAPTVGVEKIARGDEMLNTVRGIEHHLQQAMQAIVIGEIGGSNALMPIICALQMNLPVIDGDGMGRAFPELQMDTFSIGGVSHAPMGLGDVHGNVVLFHQMDSAARSEKYARVLTIEMGGSAGLGMPVMKGHEMKKYIIRGTLSLAKRIGDTVLAERRKNTEPSEAVAALCNGQVLFRGKISDVERRTVQGFARGKLKLSAFGNPSDVLDIVFQNENLLAWHNGEIVCTVPDLICILNLEDGEPIGTEVLRYGLRVAVLALPAPKELKTPQALEVVGPQAFGYPDIAFQALAGNLL